MAYANNKICSMHNIFAVPPFPSPSFVFYFLGFIFILQFHFSHLMASSAGDQNYQKCKKTAGECVCLAQSIVEYFDEALNVPSSIYSRAPHVMFDRVESFRCPEYIPLPPHILIRMSESAEIPQIRYFSKRKYRAKRDTYKDETKYSKWGRRRRRQLSLGYPTEEKLAEVVAALPPSSSSHYYVPLGSEVTLHCYGSGGKDSIREDQGFYGSFRKFEWTHGHDQPVTAPLVMYDQTTGDLTFRSVRLADTGIYTCKVKSGEEDDPVAANGRDLTEKGNQYQSQLDVIAAPMLWLRFWIVYTVDRCRQRELFEIQRQIKDVVHTYVCHFCPVRNISVNCINLNGGGGGDPQDRSKYVQISLAVSTLGFERLLPAWDHYSYMCPVACQEEMHLKIIQALTESLTKLFSLQVLVQPIEGEPTIYTPQVESLNDDIALGCPSGFFENYKLCFPCSAGHYSPHGKSECVLCEEGSFQPNPGSSACFHCPKGHSTLGVGSLSQMSCVLVAATDSWKFIKDNWIIVGSCTAAGLVVLFILMVVCCCPNSCLGKCFCCACCSKNEKSDKKDGEYEKLINEEHDANNENFELTEVNENRTVQHNFRRGKKLPRYQPLPHDYSSDESYYDDRNKHQNETNKANTREMTVTNSFHQNQQKHSSLNRVRGTQTEPSTFTHETIQPRPAPCHNTRVVDLDHHQLSEQVPFQLQNQTTNWKPSHLKQSNNAKRSPPVHSGIVLHKSNSLEEKLRIQRRKLGERSSRSSSRSGSPKNRNHKRHKRHVSDSSRSSSPLPSTWKKSQNSHPNRSKLPPPIPNRRRSKVHIAEEMNTYKTFSEDEDYSRNSSGSRKQKNKSIVGSSRKSKRLVSKANLSRKPVQSYHTGGNKRR